MLKRIGIDIDSTINRAHYFDIVHGREFCKKNNFKPTEKFNECGIKQMFGLTDELYKKYMIEYFSWNVNNNIPELGAPEAIRMLARLGFQICIVTARDENYDDKRSPYKGYMMKKDTINWFINNDIPVHEFYFSATDKYKVCKENNIDILIDDAPNHIKECADNGLPVIIKSQSYNEPLIHYPNTYYANSWMEIERVIESLQYLM